MDAICCFCCFDVIHCENLFTTAGVLAAAEEEVEAAFIFKIIKKKEKQRKQFTIKL